MLKKNSFLTGILIGLIFPAIASMAAYLLKDNSYILNKPALPYIVAVALNLVLIRFSIKKGNDFTGRGAMLITFVFMIAIFIFVIHRIR